MNNLFPTKWLNFFTLSVLAFIFSPILSTQETASPGALYVLGIVVPTLLYMPFVNSTSLKGYHFAAIVMFFFLFITSISSPVFRIDTVLKNFAFTIYFICITKFVYLGNNLRVGFRLYTLLATIIAILIILSAILGYPHIESYYYTQRYSIGITGLFKNPNYLASFINLSFYVVLFCLFYKKKNFLKSTIYITCLTLFLIAIFLTGSRAALITLISSFVAVMMSYTLNKKNGFGSILLFLTIVFILYFNRDTIGTLFELFVGGNRDFMTDDGRSTSWSIAFSRILESPIWGYGIDGWSTMNYGNMFYLHNVILELIVNQGFLGFFLFLFILFYGFGRIKRDDRFFVCMFYFVTIFPILFQNGVNEVNFWRMLILNRIVANYSIYSKYGIISLITKGDA